MLVNVRPIHDVHKQPHTPPKDIASLLVFLVSDLSSAINGSIIPIDRGWSTI